MRRRRRDVDNSRGPGTALVHLLRGCSVALGAALVVSFLNFTLEPAGVSSPRHARVEGYARRQVRRSIFLIGESVAYNVSPSAGRRRRRAATDRRSSSTCSAALGGPTRNHRATPRGFAASRRRSAGSMARFPEAGPPRAGLTLPANRPDSAGRSLPRRGWRPGARSASSRRRRPRRTGRVHGDCR